MPAIILTRPIGQSHRLSELLSERAPQLLQVQLPLLSIVPSEDPQELARLKKLIQEVDLVVFVSPNAIECGLRAWGAQWSTRLPVAVVGGGSLETLSNHGISHSQGYQIIYPKNPAEWDSEGLWASLNQWQTDWKNKKILFVKGSGGREWLGEQFLLQGAEIYAVCTYRRLPLPGSAPAWQSLKQLSPGETACVLTSSEALQHFAQTLHQDSTFSSDWFNLATMICSHPRIAQVAHDAGFKQVELCEAGDENIVRASQAWLTRYL